MATSSETSSRLDEVVEEIRAVAAKALERKKSGDEPIVLDDLRSDFERDFSRSIDAYVEFLDDVDCLDVDDQGRIRLNETVARPIKAEQAWRETVEQVLGGEDGSLPHPNTGEVSDDEESADGDELPTDETLTPGSVAQEDQPTPPGISSSSSAPDGGDETSRDTDDTPDETTQEESVMEDREASTTGERQYEYTREIGSGAFGTVYEGRDTNLERAVAIKKIRNVFDVFTRLDRQDVVDRFREMTRAQARISHPAVIQIYDVETSEEYPFAVTEYAPGGNLRQVIDDDDQQTLSYALEYFIQVLHGVHAAHERDLVHGNLKPENVVLDAAGNAKISDFGMTTIVDLDGEAADEIYVGVGAPEYKSPEQIKAGVAGGVRSDIWALGILLYEMLTGEIPSRRSPMPSEKHPEIPRGIDDIFDRMSLDDPEERYPSVEAVLTDIYGDEEIVRLLDRRSGVIHLADPLEHGRRPAVENDSHLRPSTLDDAGASDRVGAKSVGAVANSDADSVGGNDTAESAGGETAEADRREASPADSEESVPAADGGSPPDPTPRAQSDADDEAEDKSSWSLF